MMKANEKNFDESVLFIATLQTMQKGETTWRMGPPPHFNNIRVGHFGQNKGQKANKK